MAKQADQQAQRRSNVYQDQHGRKWWAAIEISTGDPTGPISLMTSDLPIRRDPPLIPPQKYLHVDSEKDFRALEIRYDQWLQDVREAHGAYQEQMWFHANRLFGDKAAEALENPPPALLQVVGRPPQHEQPILAAKSGRDPWILGMSDEKPYWARRHYPDSPESTGGLPADLAFLAEQPPEAAVETVEYPENYAPARWRLSNGETLQGSRDDAEAAEAALQPVGA